MGEVVGLLQRHTRLGLTGLARLVLASPRRQHTPMGKPRPRVEDKSQETRGSKRKLTKKEKEKAERELRANLPTREQVGRKGVFEMSGPLEYTFAVGQIPGGPFRPVDVIIKGHKLYLFEMGDFMTHGARGTPSAKPLGFFMMKHAVVKEIGVLQLSLIHI